MSVFVKSLKEKGLLEEVQIVVFVVGSRKLSINDDYGSGNWSILAPNLKIYGFDADEDACNAANADLINLGRCLLLARFDCKKR